MGDKFRVLLLCTGNSCRSQMAEGLVRYFMGDRIDVESAGVLPSIVHPDAVEVLSEMGIDISGHESQHVDEFAGEDFNLVVTLCSYAKEVCGTLPWAREQVHMGFDDPISAMGSRDEVLDEYRRVRDDVRRRLIPFVEERYEGWRLNKERGS